jgi:hypothetical protein
MASSATETAIVGLVAALTTQAGLPLPSIPVPSRNEILPSRFHAFGSVEVYFTVFDGEGRINQETLGHPDVVANTYELHQRPLLMWAVMAPDNAAREAAFDAGLVAINAALAADRTLAGAVNWCELEESRREELSTSALANVKAVQLVVRLEFLSSAPI